MMDYLTLEDIEKARQYFAQPTPQGLHEQNEALLMALMNPQPSLTYPPHETKRYDRTNKTRRKGRGKRK